MKDELAQHIAIVAFKSSSNLNELLYLISDHADEEEYQEYLRIIADISASIGCNLLQKIYDEHPEIEKEIDRRIEVYEELIFG